MTTELKNQSTDEFPDTGKKFYCGVVEGNFLVSFPETYFNPFIAYVHL